MLPVSKVYEFHVEMTCEGCVNAVNRILSRHQGKDIEKFSIDLNTKTVTITTLLEKEAVIGILEKSGKDINLRSITDAID